MIGRCHRYKLYERFPIQTIGPHEKNFSRMFPGKTSEPINIAVNKEASKSTPQYITGLIPSTKIIIINMPIRLANPKILIIAGELNLFTNSASAAAPLSFCHGKAMDSAAPTSSENARVSVP